MKKHASGFRTSTPATNFSHFCKDGLTPLLQHTEWLHNIRQTMWDRVQFENEMVPTAKHRCTTSALEYIMLGIGCLERG